MDGWRLSIDFGTSFTTAAMEVAGTINTLEIGNSRYLPSLVALGTTGTLVTGGEAVHLAALMPDRVERLPKRALVRSDHVLMGGTVVATADLVAAVLGRVYGEALLFHGGRAPEEVVLTHPAKWGREDLRKLGQAADAAGVRGTRGVRFMPEPVAAVLHYAAGCPVPQCAAGGATGRDVAVGGCVAVYDLGGGTFDTAVLRRTERGFETVGKVGGDPFLGGEDFNERLRDLLGACARAVDPGPWDDLWESEERAAKSGRAQVIRDVVAAKEALSSLPEVAMEAPGYDVRFLIRRHQFEEAVSEDLERSVKQLLDTIGSAGLAPGDLDALVLAGGASRMPRVSDLLAERLGLLPHITPDPKSVVAHGVLLALADPPPPPPPPSPDSPPEPQTWYGGGPPPQHPDLEPWK